MAFAIYFDQQDWATVAAQATRQDIPASDRSLAQSCWNAGLKDYQTAPVAPQSVQDLLGVPPNSPATDLIKYVVISGKHQGQDITPATIGNLLKRIAAYNVTSVDGLLNELGNQIQPNSAFVKDPYP